MSVDFHPSEDYPGRTDMTFKMREDSNQSIRIALSDEDMRAIEQYVNIPVSEPYECPQHDNCDGGCGVVYKGAEMHKAIEAAIERHVLLDSHQCICGWKPDYSVKRRSEPYPHFRIRTHRKHVAEVIFRRVVDAM